MGGATSRQGEARGGGQGEGEGEGECVAAEPRAGRAGDWLTGCDATTKRNERDHVTQQQTKTTKNKQTDRDRNIENQTLHTKTTRDSKVAIHFSQRIGEGCGKIIGDYQHRRQSKPHEY